MAQRPCGALDSKSIDLSLIRKPGSNIDPNSRRELKRLAKILRRCQYWWSYLWSSATRAKRKLPPNSGALFRKLSRSITTCTDGTFPRRRQHCERALRTGQSETGDRFLWQGNSAESESGVNLNRRLRFKTYFAHNRV